MRVCSVIILFCGFWWGTLGIYAQNPRFDPNKDLLLAQFDCKTDVDDLHTVAALATMLNHPDYRNVNYYAVAGTYGIQKGRYVPANELFQLAFDNRWSSAHEDGNLTAQKILSIVERTLKKGGDVWVAEAGQSDFSAQWIRTLLALQPQLSPKKRIHIVQHSDWNEDVTSPENLQFVKETTDYRKIPDGNAGGNGSPGFRSDEKIDWKHRITDPKLRKIWETALRIGNQYNGKKGRYLNTAIAGGGLDFSDLVETCYILGLDDLKDANAFFAFFAQ